MEPDTAARLPLESLPTVVVSRLVRPGHEHDFERWAEGFGQAMAAFPGHVSCRLVPPVAGAQREWIFVFTFDSAASLKAWVESDIRADWLARARAMVVEEGPARVVSGLESLFGLLPPSVAPPPPVWKVAVSVLVGLYPVSLLNAVFLAPRLGGLPLAWRVLVSAVVVVGLMTWVVMPTVTRLLRRWLYPGAGTDS